MNKRQAVGQIAKRWRRLEKAQRAYQRCLLREHKLGFAISPPQLGAKKRGTVMEPKEGDPELRYYISSSKNKPIDLSVLVQNKKEDPAYKVNFFLPIIAKM